MRKINQKKKTVFIFGMVAVIAIFAAFFCLIQRIEK